MLSLAESEAALRSGGVAAVVERDIVVVDGPEAASYLHGQVSQNIEGLAVGSSAWTLLLEPTGRVTAWARVSRVGDEVFWLDVDTGSGADMLARLERFKLRTKATFELRSGVPTLAVRGPAASTTVEEVRASLSSDLTAVADINWPGSVGVDVLGLDSLPEALASAVGALAAPEIAELERIEAGRPAMGREFGEKTIPAETGVVERSADFTKGCYVGQELVARVDSRGNNTPRTVHPASMASSTPPADGAELVLDGAVVGSVTSAMARSGGVAALVSVKRGVEAPVTLQVDVDGTLEFIDVAEVNWV